MSRTSQRIDSALPLEHPPLGPLQAAATPVRDVPPSSAPSRVRRRRVSPRYLAFRILIGWRRRRLNGDAALLVLCFLLFAATIAVGVGLVIQAG